MLKKGRKRWLIAGLVALGAAAEVLVPGKVSDALQFVVQLLVVPRDGAQPPRP